MTTVVKSVLFVCMGNICRSPTAEAVLRKRAAQAGLSLEIDSAGTAAYHQGEGPDTRTVAAGVARGYDFKEIFARQVTEDDFEHFDLILAADRQNLKELKRICPAVHQHKLQLMLAFGASSYHEVPDPYYGGKGGFETVLDLLEQSCDGLIATLLQRVDLPIEGRVDSHPTSNS